MATSPHLRIDRDLDAESRRYPTSDGKPIAESDIHRQVMADLIEVLQARYADDPQVYVSGDLLLFYEEGNKRRHVAPDVFVVFGVVKRPRLNYPLWSEGKGPDVVIEVTSKTTRREDQTKKRTLYQDVPRVPEYFQIDPTEDYLRPPLQGHRLVDGGYVPIDPVDGRLPSDVLGLLLERDGERLHLIDPNTGRRLLPGRERVAEVRAEADHAIAAAQAEADRLRQELEQLRRRLGENGA
jgi:Uma2 family endonuclease